MYEYRASVVRWRVAKLQWQFPRNSITHFYTYYWEKTKLPIYEGALDKELSAKRMSTTILNRMEEAKSEYKPTLYIPTIESIEAYTKVSKKLQQNQEKLEFYTAQVERLKMVPTGDRPFMEEIPSESTPITALPPVGASPEAEAT